MKNDATARNLRRQMKAELRVAFECGYKSCEKGENIQMGLSKFEELLK